MELAYWEARRDILETTELGYTLKSQDKLWTCFIVDEFSEDEFRHNRLFFRKDQPKVMAYDVWDDELFWTSRREAEEFAARYREEHPDIEVFVINWGDDRRFESSLLDRGELLQTGKYAGSSAALARMAKATQDWRSRNA